MGFIFLVFLSAFGLEAIGSYVSIIGLSQTFNGDPVILTFAVFLDVCKIIVVSLLYKNWRTMPGLMKAYLLPATLITMLITSYGAAGYLSQSFQSAILPNQQAQITLDANMDEKSRLQERKLDIDKQISQLPNNYITARQKLMKSFGPELDRINARIVELDKEIPELKRSISEIEAHIGPIAFFAEVFEVTKEQAVSIIIALLIFVFDPLAVMLILAGNFLLAERQKLSVKDNPKDDTLKSKGKTKTPAPLILKTPVVHPVKVPVEVKQQPTVDAKEKALDTWKHNLEPEHKYEDIEPETDEEIELELVPIEEVQEVEESPIEKSVWKVKAPTVEEIELEPIEEHEYNSGLDGIEVTNDIYIDENTVSLTAEFYRNDSIE